MDSVNTLNSLLQKGLERGIIALDNDKKNITYTHRNKKYRFSDPEEQVRAETYCSLVLNYGYKPERIDFEVKVPRRTPSDLADIVVYNDDALKAPYIVVECKKEEVSQAEFTQAIEQGFGNINSLGGHYLVITSGIKTQYFNRKDYPPMEREENEIADIPKFGQTKTARFKYVKGGQGGFELETVSEQELTRRFKQAHDALWAGGKRNPSAAFDELDKLIFCKMWDENNDERTDGEPYDFQIFAGEVPETLLKRVRTIYQHGKEKDAEVFKDDIRLNAQELRTVVGYLAPIHLTSTDLDSKGRAFETFMGSFFRGEFGQYFTPRNIVKFIVDVLPIKNDAFVLDTSCGSGGFLLYALDKVRAQASTRFPNRVANQKDAVKHYKYWHDFAEKNLYGIEISEDIARAAKMNMIIHDDGHTNVVTADGLEPISRIRELTKHQGFAENRFDFILTNPPFGSSVKFNEHRYLEQYDLGVKELDWIDAKLKGIKPPEPRNSQDTEILFIEQCHRFLKPNGILAMVIPDGILTNSSSQYVRDWIEEHYRILAVVSMPQTAFSANDAGVKSSVIFLRKHKAETTAAIREEKARQRETLFDAPEFGVEIRRLLEEKDAVLKRGDETTQRLQEDLAHQVDALREQGTLTKPEQRELEKQTKEAVKAHQQTDEYKRWREETSDSYNERIQAVREALSEEFIRATSEKLQDYPIFMALAEQIGYDATGRTIPQNDLDTITPELACFIESVVKEEDDFFA